MAEVQPRLQRDGAPTADEADVQSLVQLALAEDGRDLTSELIFPDNPTTTAVVLAQAAGVLCGLALFKAVFARLDEAVVVTPQKADGERLQPGETILRLQGPIQALLRGERPALNFLQQLSGVASLTRRFVDAAAGTRLRILDTRKTLPGWRRLQKYAVRVGGGDNHRLSLQDALMVKDNHSQAMGGVRAAVERLRAAKVKLPLFVEAQSLADVKVLLDMQVDRIMLDNFTVAQVKSAVELCAGKVPLEVTGGVTLESVRDYAATGVDCASVGRLTHSAPALEMSMETPS